MNPAEPTFADWIALAALAAFCLTLLALFARDLRAHVAAWFNRAPIDLDRADRCGPQCCRDQRNTH